MTFMCVWYSDTKYEIDVVSRYSTNLTIGFKGKSVFKNIELADGGQFSGFGNLISQPGRTYYVNNNTVVSSSTINVVGNVETKWVAMSSGLPGELVKISSHPLG